MKNKKKTFILTENQKKSLLLEDRKGSVRRKTKEMIEDYFKNYAPEPLNTIAPQLYTPLTAVTGWAKWYSDQAKSTGMYQNVVNAKPVENKKGEVSCENRLIDLFRALVFDQLGLRRTGPWEYGEGAVRILLFELGYLGGTPRGGAILKFAKTLQYITYFPDFFLNGMKKPDNELNKMSYEEFMSIFAPKMKRFYEMQAEECSKLHTIHTHGYTITRIEDRQSGGGFVLTDKGNQELDKYAPYCDWCICGPQRSFEYSSYTTGAGAVYVMAKDGFQNIQRPKDEEGQPTDGRPLDEYGLSLVCIIVGIDGLPDLVTTRYNHSYGGENNVEFLLPAQIKKRTGIDFFSAFPPRTKQELANLRLVDENSAAKTIILTEKQSRLLSLALNEEQSKKKTFPVTKVNAGIMDAVTAGGTMEEGAEPEADEYTIGAEEPGGNNEYFHINESTKEEFENYKQYFTPLAEFMRDEGLNVYPFPKVKLNWEEQDGLFIKTGYYEPGTKTIVIFCKDRHPKDILRTFAHEMIHHSQNLDGKDLNFSSNDDVKDNEELEEIEAEAYLKGNVYFRKWTEYQNKQKDILQESREMLNEDQTSASIKAAKNLVMQELECSEAEANEYVRIKVRETIPATRTREGGKFILGATRMVLGSELADPEIENLINFAITLISTKYYDQYDRNLNGCSARQLIRQYEEEINDSKAKKEEELASNKETQSENYKIVRIDSFEEAQQYSKYTDIGYTSAHWCLTYRQDMYEQYTQNGLNQIYFCLRNGFENIPAERGPEAPEDEYGLSMISIIVDQRGRLKYCTCRWNHFEAPGDSFLGGDETEISKLLGVNFFKVFLPNNKFKNTIDDALQRISNGEQITEVFQGVWPLADDCKIPKGTPIPNGIYRVLILSKWNLFNTETNQFVTNTWFDEILAASEGFCSVGINNKYNLLNTETGEILSDQWFYYPSSFRNGIALAWAGHHSVFFINKNGQNQFGKKFLGAKNFLGGIAAVLIGSKSNYDDSEWCFITENGELILTNLGISHVYGDDNLQGFIVRRKDGQSNAVRQGKLLYEDGDWLNSVREFTKDGLSLVTNNQDKDNFLRKDGRIISNVWFDDCDFFENGFAIVHNRDKNNRWKINYINTEGEIISDIWFDGGDYFNKFGTTTVWVADSLYDRKYNVINAQGQLLSNIWFDDVFNTDELGYTGVIKDGKRNLLKPDGQLLSNMWFDKIRSFDNANSRATVVSIDRKYNIISKDGRLLLKEWYRSIEDFYLGFAIIRNSEGLENYVTEDGRFLLKKWVYSCYEFRRDLVAAVEVEPGAYNFVNSEGQYLSKTCFASVTSFRNGFGRVRLNGKYNYIDKQGRFLSKEWFSDCARSISDEGFAYAYVGRTRGKIYTDGRFVPEVTTLEENTNPKNIDLSSFDIKTQLNPKFWKDGRLDSRIRMKLLDIADDFIDFIGIDWVKPEDVIITGSLANFNWNKKFSDIDLHILIDYSKVDKRKDFVENYFYSQKKLWNEEHKDIKIFGFPVEVFVQDTAAKHTSTGVYSLDKDKWILEPERKKLKDTKINKKYIKKKVAEFIDRIEELENNFKDADGDYETERVSKKGENLFDEIKGERKSGLSKTDNEISNGNIIFKSLRRLGYIDKLTKILSKSYDKLQSLYEGRGLLNEDQEGTSIRQAKDFLVNEHGFSEEDADDFVRNKVRAAFQIHGDRRAGKFILGLTRIMVDENIGSQMKFKLMSIIRAITSDEKLYEDYNRDLNGLTGTQLVNDFVHQIRRAAADRKIELATNKSRKVNDYTIVRIDSYNESEKFSPYTDYGDTNGHWCLTYRPDMYESYTNSETNAMYFCLRDGFEEEPRVKGANAPLDNFGLSMLCITVTPDGELNSCTSRWNHLAGGGDKVMTKEELTSFFGVDFSELFPPKECDYEEFDKVPELLNANLPLSSIFDGIHNIYDGFSIVEIKDKVNLIKDRTLLFQEWLDRAEICGDYILIGRAKKYNFIDRNGKLRFRSWFDGVGAMDVYCPIKVSYRGKVNYFNFFTGNLITDTWLPYGYDFINPPGVAQVFPDGSKFNFIDRDGKLLLPENYSYCRDFEYVGDEWLCVVGNSNSKLFCMNLNGELLFDRTFSSINLANPYIIVGDNNEGGLKIYSMRSKKWLCNGELFAEAVKNKGNSLLVSKENLGGKNVYNILLDNDGEERFLFDDWYKDILERGNFYLLKKGLNQWGVATSDGTVLTDDWYWSIRPIKDRGASYPFDEYFIITNSAGKKNALFKNGKFISDEWYRDVVPERYRLFKLALFREKKPDIMLVSPTGNFYPFWIRGATDVFDDNIKIFFDINITFDATTRKVFVYYPYQNKVYDTNGNFVSFEKLQELYPDAFS